MGQPDIDFSRMVERANPHFTTWHLELLTLHTFTKKNQNKCALIAGFLCEALRTQWSEKVCIAVIYVARAAHAYLFS